MRRAIKELVLPTRRAQHGLSQPESFKCPVPVEDRTTSTNCGTSSLQEQIFPTECAIDEDGSLKRFENPISDEFAAPGTAESVAVDQIVCSDAKEDVGNESRPFHR